MIQSSATRAAAGGVWKPSGSRTQHYTIRSANELYVARPLVQQQQLAPRSNHNECPTVGSVSSHRPVHGLFTKHLCRLSLHSSRLVSGCTSFRRADVYTNGFDRYKCMAASVTRGQLVPCFSNLIVSRFSDIYNNAT